MITETQVKKYFKLIKKISFNNDIIDVEGSVQLIKKISKLPFQFGKVSGDFNCYDNELTSLVSSPSEVGGVFDCSGNQLTSLVGSPSKVGGDFDCANNQLTSLEGSPKEVDYNFYCYGNQLISLVGSPTAVAGKFYCSNNQLTSLIGSPISVSGFICDWKENLPMLSLLKYNKLEIYENDQVGEILRKYCGKKPLRRTIIQCQKELIDARFVGNAKL